MIGARGALAIAELIFYVPALGVSIFVASKHGFGRSAGWIFLVLLSLARIGGGISELIALNSTSTDAFTTAAILSSIGFSTLLMAQLGMQKRLSVFMSGFWSRAA